MFYTDQVKNDWMSATYIRNFLSSMVKMRLLPIDEYYDIDAALVGYHYDDYRDGFFDNWTYYDMIWGEDKLDDMYEESPRERRRRKRKEKKDRLR